MNAALLADDAARDRLISFFLALLFHAAFFLPLGAFFVQSAEYDVEPGSGGVEVNLVAALPGSSISQTTPSVMKEEMVNVKKGEEKINLPIPGTSSTTFYSSGGAWTQGRSGLFKNPSPRYPELARKLGQEGRVVLTVAVDSTGHPVRVELKKGSGFPLLDESALQAVRGWKFQPKRVGSLPVESTIDVPIRFQLEKE